MTTSQDVNLVLGEVWSIICTCHDANGAIMVVDTAEWRLASTTTRLLLVSSNTDSIVITSPGVLEVTVTPTDQLTANIAPGLFQHELFVTGNNTVGSIQVAGKATVTTSLKFLYP